MIYPRNIVYPVKQALRDTPVILINGARQAGKSTFVAEILGQHHKAQYVTLDDPATLAIARTNPLGFLEGFNENLVIDEIQRAPELLLPLKKLIDQKRTPGRFILTGSADVMALPKVTESLAGRIEIHTLWPLSQGEIHKQRETFIDTVFSERLPSAGSKMSWKELAELMTQGGFPEVISRSDVERQQQWFRSYISAVTQRDIRDLANIERLFEIPNVLAILANRAAHLANFSDIARMSRISNTTLKRYISLLQAVFMITFLPAWSINRDKRLVKTAKAYINDSGLLCHLKQIDVKGLVDDKMVGGFILENFVVTELLKQTGWNKTRPSLYHFRTQTGQEVDIILEAPNHTIVGIEVKAGTFVDSSDFKGLQLLSTLAGKKFQRGIVLYAGENLLPFGKNMHAVPVASLWEW